MNEDKIRDYLKDHLSIIEEDLELIDKEYYLKGSDTYSRGFIDILAKDKMGNIVIIEIKRSNQAARQAIHEIFKYISAIKRDFCIKSSLIRSIIISTEWKELLYPYSMLLQETDYRVDGLQLNIKDGLKSASTKKIVPVEIERDFEISLNHDILLYDNKENRDKAIHSIKKNSNELILKDFFIIPMESSEPQLMYNHCLYVCREKYSLKKLYETFKKYSIDELNRFLEEFFEMIYNDEKSSLDEEEFSFDIDFIEKREKDYKLFYDRHFSKFVELIELDMIDSFFEINIDEDYFREKMLEELSCYDLKKIEKDSYEIGYSDKFISMLSDNWNLNQINGYGLFGKKDFLPDDSLINEIISSNQNMYIGQGSSSNKKRMKEIKQNFINKFYLTSNWCEVSKYIFNQLDQLTDYNISVILFNPENILSSILSNTLPYFEIIVEMENESRIYMGILDKNNKSTEITFQKILDKFFDGDIISLAMYHHLNEIYLENEILNSLGLSQNVYLIQYSENTNDISKYLVQHRDNRLSTQRIEELPETLFTDPNFKQFINDNQRSFKEIIVTI